MGSGIARSCPHLCYSNSMLKHYWGNAYIIGLALCGLLLIFHTRAYGADLPFVFSGWHVFADDLETAEIAAPNTLGMSLSLVRTSLKRLRIGVIRSAEFGAQRSSVNSLCRQSKAVACINANFFDPDGEALGLVLSHGVIRHPTHQGGNTLTGILQVTRREPRIVGRSEFQPGAVLEAVQAGPRLVTDGKAVAGIRDSGRARRSGVCIDSRGRLIFLAGGVGRAGWSVEDLQAALLDSNLNCVEALNLDGGGSTQLFVSGLAPGAPAGTEDINIEGYDNIPIALGLFVP